MRQKNSDNANLICEHIIAEQSEYNIKETTKTNKIKTLVYLSRHFDNTKSFRDMTKYDILNHMNALRNNNNTINNKWIGTYNYKQNVLTKFFRWLYNQQEPDPRKRITPDCIKGIKKLPRKDKTTYNSGEIWDQRENAIFLKYCPLSRDRCYHANGNGYFCQTS